MDLFFYNPGRSLSTAFVTLLFSTLWVALALKNQSPGWALFAAGLALFAIFIIWHSAKWQIRRLKAWLQ